MDIQTMYLVLGLSYLVFGLMLLFQLREEPGHRIPFYAGAKILQGLYRPKAAGCNRVAGFGDEVSS